MSKCGCYDCGLDYEQFGYDFVIQNELWREISPTHNDGGILCSNCMCKRMMNLGMSAIWVVVYTGEIKTKNNPLTKLVNICRYIRNEYKAWQCQRWIDKQ